ncbi:MAG: DMT family transporter [Pseudomonadota bacterium]
MVTARTRAFAAALTTVVLWAGSFPLATIALGSFEPAALAAFRIGMAACLMLIWWAWRRPRLPSLVDALRLALCGGIGIGAYNLLINAGQQTVAASATSFIVNVAPVITAALGVAFLNERFTNWAWAGTLISFIGVAVIAIGQPGGLTFGAGSSLILAAAVSQAVFFVLQRPLLARYGPSTCAPAVIIFGALCLAPWLPGAIPQVVSASGPALLSAIMLAVFPAAIGYATWGVAQAYFGASRAANFLYLVPPVATVMELVVLGKGPTVTTLVGGTLAVAGVALVNAFGRE